MPVASSTASASAANSALGVGLRLVRPVGAAVAAPVEGDHAEVAREVRDLHLPEPRVDDRPGRQQQDRRLARAVDLVEDADAVALDVALVVGVAGARLLRVPVLRSPPWALPRHGALERRRLNGVTVALEHGVEGLAANGTA